MSNIFTSFVFVFFLYNHLASVLLLRDLPFVAQGRARLAEVSTYFFAIESPDVLGTNRGSLDHHYRTVFVLVCDDDRGHDHPLFCNVEPYSKSRKPCPGDRPYLLLPVPPSPI